MRILGLAGVVLALAIVGNLQERQRIEATSKAAAQ